MNVRQSQPARTCDNWWRKVPSSQQGAIVAEPTSQYKGTKPRQPQKHPAKPQPTLNAPDWPLITANAPLKHETSANTNTYINVWTHPMPDWPFNTATLSAPLRPCHPPDTALREMPTSGQKAHTRRLCAKAARLNGPATQETTC